MRGNKTTGRIGRRGIAAIVLALVLVPAGAASAGDGFSRSCTIKGTNGDDSILLVNKDNPDKDFGDGFDLIVRTNKPETVCTGDGDDFVDVNYKHKGTTKVETGAGDDRVCAGANRNESSKEKIDGGGGFDQAVVDIDIDVEIDRTSNVEEVFDDEKFDGCGIGVGDFNSEGKPI